MSDDWDAVFGREGRVWGEGPSELAPLAVDVLRGEGVGGPGSTVLDMGCGYGRDARHLWSSLAVSVVGVDPSPQAIALAIAETPAEAPIEYICADFDRFDTADTRLYDAVVCANLAHLLEPVPRRRLVAALIARLKPRGLLFVMALAPGDPQHYGKGVPVAGESDSFFDRTYLHFASEEELRGDFDPVKIELLERHAYREPREDGTVHDHLSWRMVARR